VIDGIHFVLQGLTVQLRPDTLSLQDLDQTVWAKSRVLIKMLDLCRLRGAICKAGLRSG